MYQHLKTSSFNQRTNNFIFDTLKASNLGILAGASNVGKSYFILTQLIKSILVNYENYIIDNVIKLKFKRAYYLSYEDDGDTILDRIENIIRTIFPGLELKEYKRLERSVRKRLHVFCDEFLNDDNLDDFWNKAYQNSLIVIDTLNAALPVKNENDNAEFARLLEPFRVRARQKNSSILFIHHLKKDSNIDVKTVSINDIRGASSLVAYVRYAAILLADDDKDIIYKVVKSSNAPKNINGIKFRGDYWQSGFIEADKPITAEPPAKADEELNDDDDFVTELLENLDDDDIFEKLLKFEELRDDDTR